MTDSPAISRRLPTATSDRGSTPTQGAAPTGGRPIGRIPVEDVLPAVDGGTLATCSVVDEEFEVTATVFREGHDAVNATVVLTDPQGRATPVPMTCVNAGLDHWTATVSADREGSWHYRVEGWSDPYGTWTHDAVIKVAAGVDVDLMLDEGVLVLQRALDVGSYDASSAAVLRAAIVGLADTSGGATTRLAAGTGADVRRVLADAPLRDSVSPSADIPWLVERKLALTGAWYEMFPRSEGCRQTADGDWVSGTFATASKRLPAIAAMGFDVVYLTPVHPIGQTNRKGPNNTLNAGPKDPGSPYAIGSAQGGHDALHPDLGGWDDFDAFVTAARRGGLEVALDLALQCSPDHPWVSEHPEFFTMRADGTIAFAENPPKKYQDIYPMNFDTDPAASYAAVRAVVQVWIDHGVKIFRVDNPHTKPVQFWQWLIADVANEHPEVIWLAEAFTRPAMMHTLGKAGFQQSYTYYAWRNDSVELREYVEELAGESAAYMRPSFWPTTHDILTPYMQYGGPNAWKLRAALAATLSPTYGIYAGYELVENVARPGAEEQIDNEKYQYKDRHWSDYEPGGPKAGQSLAPFLTTLNRIRREHHAFDWLRNITFHEVDDPHLLVFSKRRGDDVVIVVANCDPHATRESTVHLDLAALGLPAGSWFSARELITGADWHWGEHNYVRLGPEVEPVHIVHVRSA